MTALLIPGGVALAVLLAWPPESLTARLLLFGPVLVALTVALAVDVAKGVREISADRRRHHCRVPDHEARYGNYYVCSEGHEYVCDWICWQRIEDLRKWAKNPTTVGKGAREALAAAGRA